MKGAAGLIVAMAVAVGGAHAADTLPPQAYTAAYLADRAQIEDVISALALTVDQRRWDAARATLADEVELGYPSDQNGQPGPLQISRISADAFIAASRAQLPGYLHTQHMVTNPLVTVERDRAHVKSQMQLSHYLPNDEGEAYWIVVGTYDYDLIRTPAGWRISAMHVNKLFELGNARLPALASKRVAAGQIATGP
jgi:hypothetical protein